MYRTKKIQLPEKTNRATIKHISPRAQPGTGWLSGDSVVAEDSVVDIDGVDFVVIVVVPTVVVWFVVDIVEVVVDIDGVVWVGVDVVEVMVCIDGVDFVGTTVAVWANVDVDVDSVESDVASVAVASVAVASVAVASVAVASVVVVVPGVVDLFENKLKDLFAIVVLGVLITFITISRPFLISSLMAFKLKSDIVISPSSKLTVLS